MKLIRKAGATSNILQIFIADSSSTTGAGLTGLVFNSGSLTAYYHRDTDTTATVMSLVTMTVGTFTSLGFKEIDATNMPGWYQFCPPDAALAAGAKSVGFHLKGASNMAPLPIEVDLDAQVDVTFWNGTAVATPATAGIPDVNAKNWNNLTTVALPLVPTTAGRTLDVSATGEAGLDWANIGAPTTAQGLTGTTISTAQVVASVTGAVGSVTADCGITQAAADKVFGASGAAIVELAGVPSATPNAGAAIMLPFMELRNKLTTTATAKTVFNSAGSAITSKVLSDDTVTYTEAKMT